MNKKDKGQVNSPHDTGISEMFRKEQPPVTELANHSPQWSSTIKLVMGLSLAALMAGLVVGFRTILGPLLLSFIVAYLFYPVADFLRKLLRFKWRGAVNLIYLVVLLLLLGLLTWGGIAIVQQVQSLINFLQTGVTDLPNLITDFISRPIQFGPFNYVPKTADLTALVQQIFNLVQPMLSQLGTLVGSFATGAASSIGWMLFILVVSYFILAESEGNLGGIFHLTVPGYQVDLDRLGVELKRIWNAFLRGQMLIVLLTILVYVVLLGGLGVRYFYVLALMAGLARFVPYIGPFVSWVAYALVSFFQGPNIFGWQPLVFALLVVGIAWVTDLILDNLVMTRLMADALRVHPAAVMVAALVSASLMGIIGIVLAAPVMASAKLLLEYTFRKLADLDPWEGIVTPPPPPPLREVWQRTKATWQKRFKSLQRLARGSH